MDPIQFIVEWIDIETPLAEEAQFMKDIQSTFGPSQSEKEQGIVVFTLLTNCATRDTGHSAYNSYHRFDLNFVPQPLLQPDSIRLSSIMGFLFFLV